MIKSVNQLITERCNSRCQMCSIWRLKRRSKEMNPEEFSKLYSHPEFKEVEDLCISGGEPTLRSDLLDIMDSILPYMPKLRMLFLSTNGSNPDVAEKFVRRYASLVNDVYICISLEGNRETHLAIRGVDTYSRVIETAEKIKSTCIKNVHVIFSMTITPYNCNSNSLLHVKKIAQQVGGTYSFRPASQNDTFYHNCSGNKFMISNKDLEFLKRYIKKNNINDPFLDILFQHIRGHDTLMGNKKSGINCLAGDISVFIKPDGAIFPCINSRRRIGDKNRGVYIKDYKLGDKELCPCCTECQIYPMLNFSKYSSKNGI